MLTDATRTGQLSRLYGLTLPAPSQACLPQPRASAVSWKDPLPATGSGAAPPALGMPRARVPSSPASHLWGGCGKKAEGRGWGQQGLGNCQVHGASGGPGFCLLTLSCGHRRKPDIPSLVTSLSEFYPPPPTPGPLWSWALPPPNYPGFPTSCPPHFSPTPSGAYM